MGLAVDASPFRRGWGVGILGVALVAVVRYSVQVPQPKETQVDELELAERVAAGAEFMDAIDAEWFWTVDPKRLDMSQIWMFQRGRCGCVLSQYDPRGDYDPSKFGLDAWEGEDAALGFYTSSGPDEYRNLTALWREAITDRRAAWFDKHPEYVIA